MNEKDVTHAFEAYLLDRGWDIETEAGDHTDVRAKRGAELLVAEVKGVTKSPETAVDIGYGQLLRAMSRHPEATDSALVVLEHLKGKATRVSAGVRQRLGVSLYLVDDLGHVRLSDS